MAGHSVLVIIKKRERVTYWSLNNRFFVVANKRSVMKAADYKYKTVKSTFDDPQ